MRKPDLFFLLTCLLVTGARDTVSAQTGKVVFFGFESPAETWVACPGNQNGVRRISQTQNRVLEGTHSLEVQMTFPGEAAVEKSFYRDLTRYRHLIFNIYAGEIPDDLRVVIFLQDAEWLWYQTPLMSLQKNRWNKLTLNVQPDSAYWEPINHAQPWSIKAAANIKKIGLKVFCSREAEVTLWLDEIAGELVSFPEVTISSRQVPCYSRLELTFNLPEDYSNPFNPEEVEVSATFLDPDGQETVLPGFYYQTYQASLIDGQELLAPEGYPCWKVRFSPRKCGQHSCRIKVRDKHGERESQRISFLTVPSNNPGFIEVSSLDGRYFQFSNGSFFYPLGLNIRSPTDTRYAHLRKRPLDPDSGTFYYEKIFQQMKQSGQNFCEVWMANWFAALEWIENRPGYRGAGFYNLRHAWKLDRLLELAETNGIYLQIVLINHGQLSTYCDEEWPDHPYNEKNGGFLKKPEEFFTDTRAEQLMRRKFRYIVARWSYSPNIFGWVLLNEINLTGSRRDFYLSPAVTTWYERLAGYLKKIDPYHHLVSAHYTILVDNDLLRSSVVDYTITNAYYESGRTSLVEFLKEIYRFNARFDKPTFVSEFGGTPWGATDPNLVRDVIAGLWGSFHLPFAGAPAFWWHRLVTELNLYPIYQNLARYAASVDRLKTALEIEEVKTEGKIKTLGLGNFCEALVWVYDPLVMTRIQDLTSFSELRDVRIALGKKKPGRYKVEFWSMEDGFLQEGTVENQSDTLSVTLPPFRRWLAVKIKAEV